MPSRDLAHLHPDLAPKATRFLDWMKQAGFPVFIHSTYRTQQEQDALYSRGRDPSGRVVDERLLVTWTRNSLHSVTLPDGTPAARAFDFAFVGHKPFSDDHPWTVARAYATSILGLEILPKGKDPGHLQLPEPRR